MAEALGVSLQELITSSPWTYLIVTGSIAGSAVFLPLPSESMLVTAMSLSVAGELEPVALGTSQPHPSAQGRLGYVRPSASG